MSGYIPKSWRQFVGFLEPKATPAAPLQAVKLPDHIGSARCHADGLRTVQTFLDELTGGTEFTLADLAHAAGMTSDKLNQPVGTDAFRGVVRSLMLGGRVVKAQKGRRGGNVAQSIAAISDEIGLL